MTRRVILQLPYLERSTYTPAAAADVLDAVLKVCRNKWGDSDVELPVDAEGTFTLVRDAGADTAWIFRDGLLVAPASIEDADDIARDISALTGGPQLGGPNFFQWAEG